MNSARLKKCLCSARQHWTHFLYKHSLSKFVVDSTSFDIIQVSFQLEGVTTVKPALQAVFTGSRLRLHRCLGASHPWVLLCARAQSRALRCVLLVLGQQVSILKVQSSTRSIELISIGSSGLVWRFSTAWRRLESYTVRYVLSVLAFSWIDWVGWMS